MPKVFLVGMRVYRVTKVYYIFRKGGSRVMGNFPSCLFFVAEMLRGDEWNVYFW